MSLVASTSGRRLDAFACSRSRERSAVAPVRAPRSFDGRRRTNLKRRSRDNPSPSTSTSTNARLVSLPSPTRLSASTVAARASPSDKAEVGFHVSRMRATEKSKNPPPSLLPSLSVREATTDAELRAASFLRAKSFYVYPPEREFAGKIHQTIKAQEEFDALVARKAAMERELKENSSPKERAAALVALAPADAVYSPSDPGSSLPRDEDLVISADEERKDLAVVGTLDVVAARAVDGEVLLGGGNNPAYLANVCVSPAGRRRGVGAALLSRARSLAKAWGCDGLFVHSLAVNQVAERFYLGEGFVVDVEEGAAEAARRGHCLDGVEGLGRSVLYRDATF